MTLFICKEITETNDVIEVWEVETAQEFWEAYSSLTDYIPQDIENPDNLESIWAAKDSLSIEIDKWTVSIRKDLS